MANKVYPKYKAACMRNGPTHDLSGGVVKFVLLDMTAYTYNDTHEFLSDIPSGARISTTGALTGKSVSDAGAFSSDAARFDLVTGPTVSAVAMFIDTGSPASSRLVSFFDTGITGLPVTPAGANYNVIETSGSWFIL